MARAKKTTVSDEQFAAEVEKMQDSMVETLPSTEVIMDKEDSAIHNQAAHKLGLQWGKETVKKNGMEIKYLRKALDIINNVVEVMDVVDAYKEAGGDKATASRIKKILTSAMEDPACRAVVFSEESNSLQGAYQKIREIEKKAQQSAMDDGEGELLPDNNITGFIPGGIVLDDLIKQLAEVLEQVETFDDKAAKGIKAAIKSLEARKAIADKAAHEDDSSWPFKSRKEKFMGNAVVENEAVAA